MRRHHGRPLVPALKIQWVGGNIPLPVHLPSGPVPEMLTVSMSASTSDPLFFVSVPVISFLVHCRRFMPLLVNAGPTPTFVALNLPPVASMVPVGCVRSGSLVAAAIEGTA